MDQNNAATSKILIADDDEALLRLYDVQLRNSGYTVVTALDGDECLQQVVEEKPNLVLLDIVMPKRDGLATLKALKENPDTAAIPVIMLTNFGQEDLIQNALAAGASDYLLKYRVTPSEISEKVAQILQPQKVQL